MGIPPSPAGLPSAHRTVTAHRNPARRYLGRAEEYQVAVHAALQLGIVVGQQPGCGVAWQATDYVGLELVDRPVVHLRAQVAEEPHGRDLARRQQGAGAWHDQPVPQARRWVLQQLHRPSPSAHDRALSRSRVTIRSMTATSASVRSGSVNARPGSRCRDPSAWYPRTF